MTRERYVHIINDVRDDLLRLGNMVEQSLDRVIVSLETCNVTTAGWIIQDDQQIDQLQLVIEDRVERLLATQQPVAGDLRLLTVITAVASELERVGDYVTGIAKRVRHLADLPAQANIPPETYEMIRLARYMLHESLRAFLQQDSDLARSLVPHEERMDAFEAQLRAQVLDQARADPQRLDAVVDVVDILHVIERIADRATNIGERVIYLVTSTYEQLNP